MNCIKCGREIDENAVFCADCLAVMEKYPVKKDTPVQFPKRDVEEAAKKAARRRTVTPEEMISRMRVVIRRQNLLLILLAAALAVFVWLYFTNPQLVPKNEDAPIGQNYTVDTTVNTGNGNVSRETNPTTTGAANP